MKRLGIDFGSSYIKCSDAKKGELIPLDKKAGGESVSKIPNIITYYNDNVVKLGNRSFKMRNNDEFADSVTIDKIKTRLSDPEWRQSVSGGRSVNAADVTNDIMKCLFELIHVKNKNENDFCVTITTPVCFSERQREIVRKAAANAGFKVESVITEPFASLFYLMEDRFDENHNVLIIDIGGGTLDICLVSIDNTSDCCVIKTESTAGMNFGGITINNQIIEKILMPEYNDKLSPVINDPENKRLSEWNRSKLFYAVDECKEELFTEDYDEDDIDEKHDLLFGSWDELLEMSVSVSDVYKMLDELKISDSIIELLDNVIDDSTLICEDITDVFLTGGSSMIPYFKNVVVEYLKENDVDNIEDLFELYNELDFEQQAVGSVALGAGIYNTIMADETDDIEIKDKIPFTIFTKDSSGNAAIKLKADCAYKSYRSLECCIESSHILSKKIEVFQKMPDESGENVYIGYIPLESDIADKCTLYRLGIEQDRKVFAEFGVVEGNKNDASFIPYGEKQYLEIDI